MLMQCLINWYSYTSIYNHNEAHKHLLRYFTLHSHTDCVTLDNIIIITKQQQSITKNIRSFVFMTAWKKHVYVLINWHITSLSNECRNAVTRMDSFLSVYVTSIRNIPLRTETDPKYIMFIALQKHWDSWLYTVPGLCVKCKYAN